MFKAKMNVLSKFLDMFTTACRCAQEWNYPAMVLKCTFSKDSSRLFMACAWQAREDTVPVQNFQNCSELFSSPLHPELLLSLSWVQVCTAPWKTHLWNDLELPSANSCASPEEKPRRKPGERNEEPGHAGIFQTSFIFKLLNRVHYGNICWRTLDLCLEDITNPSLKRQETFICSWREQLRAVRVLSDFPNLSG